jgi:hypothetical protein
MGFIRLRPIEGTAVQWTPFLAITISHLNESPIVLTAQHLSMKTEENAQKMARKTLLNRPCGVSVDFPSIGIASHVSPWEREQGSGVGLGPRLAGWPRPLQNCHQLARGVPSWVSRSLHLSEVVLSTIKETEISSSPRPSPSEALCAS